MDVVNGWVIRAVRGWMGCRVYVTPLSCPQINLFFAKAALKRTPIPALSGVVSSIPLGTHTPTHALYSEYLRRFQGELSKTLELVDESSRRSSAPDRVVACEVWGDGVVALLGSGKVKAVSGIHSAEPRFVLQDYKYVR